jgi:hypothetical protein
MYSWWLALREIFRTRDVVTIDAMGRRFRCPDLKSKVSGLTATLLWVHQDYDRAKEIAPLFSKAGISLSELNNAYFLDERELQTLARHPLVSIGGHTTSHAALATLDESSARAELSDNRRYLENLIQSPVRHVAYPYGGPRACGYREEHLAREVGFLTGVTTQHGQLYSGKLNHFALPRIAVGGPFDDSVTFEGRMFGFQAAAYALLGSGRKIWSSSPARSTRDEKVPQKSEEPPQFVPMHVSGNSVPA